ncbi:hypothetical protein [Saccharothrix australiensis]|uniref:Uncharacterized protein n=1 Tax=Saccharothrix australiensis TaxID=2072 RepID=A0A495VRN5_9PSEU|nr:hypothetical protein [Saccharothrix australiensis]RKT51934.1 hypothetical protein C8E97_0425 [Saccharothrix australiensis]
MNDIEDELRSRLAARAGRVRSNLTGPAIRARAEARPRHGVLRRYAPLVSAAAVLLVVAVSLVAIPHGPETSDPGRPPASSVPSTPPATSVSPPPASSSTSKPARPTSTETTVTHRPPTATITGTGSTTARTTTTTTGGGSATSTGGPNAVRSTAVDTTRPGR